MPPRAIRSHVALTISRLRASPVRAQCRSRNSSTIDGGNLGAPPKPPHSSSWSAPSPPPAAAPPRGRVETRRWEAGAFPARRPSPLAQLPDDLSGSRNELVPPLLPRLRDRRTDPKERRHSAAVRRREVGTAEERLAGGREEAGHRPAAMTRHRLSRLHVDGVDVRPLLAVDLHADEVLVHVRP